MTSLTRWDPVREATTLRDAMNQLFEQAVMGPEFMLSNRWGSSIGQMNVYEADGKYICQVLLPGVTLDAIDLTVRQNTLTIKGAVSEQYAGAQDQKTNVLLREFGVGEFSRTITFPKDVNGDAVEASYDRGVLTIVVPLAEHAQPKRITVKQGSSLTSHETKKIVEGQANSDNRVPAHAG
jgi:HSP20 family protein